METLISVSGHAKYFGDRLEGARSKYTPDQISRDLAEDYNRKTGDFWVLIYLKSPETITLLGNYLNDPRVDLRGGRNDPRYHDIRPTFAAMSAEMLREMEIREFPVKKYCEHFAGDPLAPVKYLMAPIEKSQVWWEEVKSGKRALSFVGEDVEYRFKPDGSWEKFPYTGPPDSPKVKESKAKWASEISKPAPVKDWKKQWPWLAAAVTLLLVIVAWFMKTAKAA